MKVEPRRILSESGRLRMPGWVSSCRMPSSNLDAARQDSARSQRSRFGDSIRRDSRPIHCSRDLRLPGPVQRPDARGMPWGQDGLDRAGPAGPQIPLASREDGAGGAAHSNRPRLPTCAEPLDASCLLEVRFISRFRGLIGFLLRLTPSLPPRMRTLANLGRDCQRDHCDCEDRCGKTLDHVHYILFS